MQELMLRALLTTPLFASYRFLSVKHTLIDHSQTIFSPQNAASYQDFPARSAIHDLFGKKIIGLMSFLSGELEILYCGDKRVFVSFF